MWLWVLLGAIGAIVATYTRFGFNTASVLISLPIFFTAFNTLFSNVRSVRIYWRKALNILSLSSFDMQFKAVFKVQDDSKIKNINQDYLLVQDAIYSVIKSEGIEGNKNSLVEPSFDRVSGVKFFVHPHKLYMSLDQSDDSGETNLSISTSGRLKYRNGEKVLNDFLIGLYENMESLGLKPNKYTLKLSKNSKQKNFMSKHFIKELKPNEIKSFNIVVNYSNLNISANQKEIVIVTRKKVNLIKGIKYSLEMIN